MVAGFKRSPAKIDGEIKMKTYDVPENYVKILENYRLHRYDPGSFFTAVLSNNLRGAYGKGDPEVLGHMKNIMMYLENNFPLNIWGSELNVEEYLDSDYPPDLRLTK